MLITSYTYVDSPGQMELDRLYSLFMVPKQSNKIHHSFSTTRRALYQVLELDDWVLFNVIVIMQTRDRITMYDIEAHA